MVESEFIIRICPSCKPAIERFLHPLPQLTAHEWAVVAGLFSPIPCKRAHVDRMARTIEALVCESLSLLITNRDEGWCADGDDPSQ